MKAFFARPIVKWILWITGIILLILIIYYIYKRVSKTTIIEDIKAQAQRDLPGAIAALEAEKKIYDNAYVGFSRGKGEPGSRVLFKVEKYRAELGGRWIGKEGKFIKISMTENELQSALTYFAGLIDNLKKGII